MRERVCVCARVALCRPSFLDRSTDDGSFAAAHRPSSMPMSEGSFRHSRPTSSRRMASWNALLYVSLACVRKILWSKVRWRAGFLTGYSCKPLRESRLIEYRESTYRNCSTGCRPVCPQRPCPLPRRPCARRGCARSLCVRSTVRWARAQPTSSWPASPTNLQSSTVRRFSTSTSRLRRPFARMRR